MNNGVCLSLPLATRCFSVTTLQAVGLLVPPCVEALCLSILLWSQRGSSGRKPWFLLSDSWLFALLNIAEFVPRLNNDFFPSLLAFQVYDRILAAASAVPILLFMIFLLSYAKGDLLPILPMRYRSSLALILLLCIPPVTISTDVAALLGFSYETSPNGSAYRFQPTFINDRARTIWSLLNSIALAVFTIYQATTFFLTGFRLSRHFFMERDESLSRRPNNDAMTIKGTGWLAAGIKLAAIETLLAFIPNGWELVFARRLCRLLGRIFLLIGLLKGMDQLDGFTLFRAASMDSIEGLPPRRIPLMDSVRERVNNPPLSTFGRQSPTARGLQDAAKVKPLPPSNLGKVNSRMSAAGKRVATPEPIVVSVEDGDVLTDFIPLARPPPARVLPRPDDKARVTLYYDGLRAPTLMLRFSALHMPSPGSVLATLRDVTPTASKPPSPEEDVKKEVPKKEVLKRRANSAYIPNPFDDADTQSLRPLTHRASMHARRRKDGGSVATVGTAAFDPIAEVRALAHKFPNPPDVPTGPESQGGHGEGENSPVLNRSSSGHSNQSSTRSNSTRRKPAPIPSPGLLAQPVPILAPPPPVLRTSMEDQRKTQARQKLRKNYIPPGTGATLRSKSSTAAGSVSTAAQTMEMSMDPETPDTSMSFRDAIDSVYDPGYTLPLSEGRPMGWLADRAIEMEAYLDKEKERRGITPPSTVTAALRTLEDRQERPQVPSPGMVAHRRPQGDMNMEYPWAQKEDPVLGANTDLEAAWKTATSTARTHEQAGGGDHTVGQVRSLSRVTSRRQPVVRPVVHSVLSISLEEHGVGNGAEDGDGDQWSIVDPYAHIAPQKTRVASVPVSEEPDSPLDGWEPSPYIRP